LPRSKSATLTADFGDNSSVKWVYQSVTGVTGSESGNALALTASLETPIGSFKVTASSTSNPAKTDSIYVIIVDHVLTGVVKGEDSKLYGAYGNNTFAPFANGALNGAAAFSGGADNKPGSADDEALPRFLSQVAAKSFAIDSTGVKWDVLRRSNNNRYAQLLRTYDTSTPYTLTSQTYGYNAAAIDNYMEQLTAAAPAEIRDNAVYSNYATANGISSPITGNSNSLFAPSRDEVSGISSTWIGTNLGFILRTNTSGNYTYAHGQGADGFANFTDSFTGTRVVYPRASVWVNYMSGL
jgi:hypothetical protein